MALDIQPAAPLDQEDGLDIQPADAGLDAQPARPLDIQPAKPQGENYLHKLKKYAGMAARASFPDLSSAYEGAQYVGQKAAKIAQDPVTQVAAKEVWSHTPMSFVNDAVNKRLTPAIQSVKADLSGLAPSEEQIMEDTQNTGQVPYGSIAAKTLTNLAVDQIPESTYGIAGALAIPKALGAVSKYAPKVLPILGKDVSGPIAGKLAAMLGQEVPRGTSTVNMNAQASPSVPRELPVVNPGTKTGDAHALFSYNDDFGPGGAKRSLYTVFGDPENAAVKKVGYGSTVGKAQLDAAGIPVTGREPRTVGKWDPLDLGPPPPVETPPPAAGATPPDQPLPDEMDAQGMSKADRVKQALVEPYQAIKYKQGQEIAPEFKDAMGDTTESYNKATVMQGKVAGKARQVMGDLDRTLEPLQNHTEYKDAERIAFLQNMKDLADQGKTTAGYTPEVIQKELGDLQEHLGPETYSRLQAAGRQFSRTASYIKLGEFVDAGMIKPERAQQLFEEYPNYVPSHIIDEAGGVIGQGQPSALGKINARMLLAKKGTGKAINENAFESIRQGVVEGLAAAEKQKVINNVAKEFATPIGARTYEDGFLVKKVNPKAIPPGYVESSIKTGDNKIYAVHKDVENLLQGLNTQSADLVTKAMSQYNRVFREGATLYRVPFVMNHAWRSFTNSVLTHRAVEGSGKFIPAIAKGLVASVSDALGHPNELFQQFERAGGGYGGMYTNITSEAGLPFRLKSLGQKAGTVFSSPLSLLGKAVRVSDNIMRVAEFERLPKTMPTDLRTANARMVGIDFSKQGDAMRVISKWIPFLNDKMQADWNFVNSAKAQPGLMMGRLAAAVAAPTVGLYQYNKQFQEDDLIDPGIRQHYFYAIVPDKEKSMAAGHLVAKTIENNGRQVPVIFRMPKIGPIRYLSNMLDGYMAYADKSPLAAQLGKTYAPGHMAQEFAGEVLPPALKLPVEQAANYQLWNGRPIVREGLENKSLPLQFDSGTTNTARLLGQATGGSPVRIEHAARSVFPAAGTGMEMTDMAMKGLQKAGVNVPQPALPRKDKSAFFQSREFQPYLSAPSGGYSVTEAQAKDATANAKAPMVDARFMAKESLLRFRQEPTDENRARVEQYWKQLAPADKTRIINQVGKQLAGDTMNPADRATMKAPKNLREMIGALVHKKRGLDVQPASQLDVQ